MILVNTAIPCVGKCNAYPFAIILYMSSEMIAFVIVQVGWHGTGSTKSFIGLTTVTMTLRCMIL